MIKVDLHKWNKKDYFTGIYLDLSPTKLDIFFSDKSFSVLYGEIIHYNYTYNESGVYDIIIEITSTKDPLKIVIKPYKKKLYDIICDHLDNYCHNKLEYIVNPMYR